MSVRPQRLEPAAATAAPRTIGRYRVERVLGEGSMGVVYQAVDPLLARTVAVKTLRRSPLLSVQAAERFRDEARAAGRLAHPGIVAVYEYADGDPPYIVMEFVDGRPLLDLTSRSARLPLPDVLSLMVQLLEALHCAHENGVCHLDIKPGNLLVRTDGRLKLTDFGISRIDDAPTIIEPPGKTVMGSPGYMAPERYSDAPPDRRVDIFSCGVLLYELLTGAPPFLGPSNAVMYQVLHVDPPAPSRSAVPQPPPACFDAIVAKAIAKRADDRYPNALALRDALLGVATATVGPRLSREAVALLRPLSVVPQPGVAAASSCSSDADTLGRLEALLLPHLGPIAKAVVRRTARECNTSAALLARLAHETLPVAERNAFISRASAALSYGRPDAPPLIPVLGATPLQPELVRRAERVLAHHVGPIAAVIARRAAAAGCSREQFFAELAHRAGDTVDRQALLADLEAQVKSPAA